MSKLQAFLKQARAELAAELEKAPCSTNNEQPPTVNSIVTNAKPATESILSFTAEDFGTDTFGCNSPVHRKRAAEIANAKVQERLAKAPVFFCEVELDGPCNVRRGRFPSHTHTARLICIEPIGSLPASGGNIQPIGDKKHEG